MPSRIVTSLPYAEFEVATGYYDTSRAPIDRIILHTMVGTSQGAAARFDNPNSHVSAHYGVRLDGSLIHWLEATSTAYHAGNYQMNQRSIGIEHEDDWSGQPPEPTRSDALYTESAKLVRDICTFYNIPIDRQHILKHNEVSDAPTGCPDALDVERIVREASVASPVPSADTQKIINDLSTARDANYNLYKQEVEKNTTLSTQITTLSQDKADLGGEVKDLEQTNIALKQNVSEVQARNSTLSTHIAEMEKADSTAIDDGIKAEADLKDTLSDLNTIAGALNTSYPDVQKVLLAVDALKQQIQDSQSVQAKQSDSFQKYLKVFIDFFIKHKTK